MIRSTNAVSLSALLVLAVSVATLAGAWGFQLIGGLAPCPMCLQQRWAYYAAVPVALAVLLLSQRPEAERLGRAALALCGLAILAGGVLAAYHAGVEWKWWPGPTSCSGTGAVASDPNALPDLSRPPVVPCDEAAWRLFGLSLAGYNVLISAALVSICAWALLGRTRTPEQAKTS